VTDRRRYAEMIDAPACSRGRLGGKGFVVETPKDIRGAFAEAISHRGPALVNVVISQGAARKPQQFRWYS
jgi:thiamine pyrophosphate-dependent acetolactate synthase large subunit-like protein